MKYLLWLLLPLSLAGKAQAQLIDPAQLRYLGSFRVPDEQAFYNASGPITVAGDRLLVCAPKVAGDATWIKVPETLAKDKEMSSWPVASWTKQNLRVGRVKPDRFLLRGLHHDGDGNLLFTYDKWYNVGGGDRNATHGMIRQGASAAEGLWYLGQNYHSSMTGGYVTEIPERHRPLFNNHRYASGFTVHQGLSKTSWGPAFFAFSIPGPSLPGGSVLPAVAYMGYPMRYPLPEWKKSNACNSMHILGDTVVYLGTRAMGTQWYGRGQEYPGPAKACSNAKGYHAPPYHAVAWFYRIEDIARGAPAPFMVRPYRVWDFSESLRGCAQAASGAFDVNTNRLYVIDPKSDEIGNSHNPTFAVFELADGADQAPSNGRPAVESAPATTVRPPQHNADAPAVDHPPASPDKP